MSENTQNAEGQEEVQGPAQPPAENPSEETQTEETAAESQEAEAAVTEPTSQEASAEVVNSEEVQAAQTQPLTPPIPTAAANPFATPAPRPATEPSATQPPAASGLGQPIRIGAAPAQQVTPPAAQQEVAATQQGARKGKKRKKQLTQLTQAVKDELAYLLLTAKEGVTAEQICTARGYEGLGGAVAKYVQTRINSRDCPTEEEKRQEVVRKLREKGVHSRVALLQQTPTTQSQVASPGKEVADAIKFVGVLIAVALVIGLVAIAAL